MPSLIAKVFLARRRYLDPFKAGIQKRMRAMLTLAERITDESIIARESADGLQAVNEW